MNNIIKKERLIGLGAVLAILFVIYMVFLYKLQIVEGEAYYAENRNNMVTTSNVTAARGNILDRYGRLLVTNKSCKNLIINTNELFPNDDSIDANATILRLVKMIREYGDDYIDELPITMEPPFEFTEISSIDEARLTAYKETNKVKENATAVELMSSMRTRYKIDSNYTAEEARIIAGVRYAVNVRYLINTSDYIFVEDADMGLISTILENNVAGVTVQESYVREYSTAYASHVLGYVNWMSDVQYPNYAALGYTADTKVGQAGAEQAFEKYLHGTNGKVKVTSAANGTVISKEYVKEPQPGNNVYLTIDISLQEAAENALASGIEELKVKLAAAYGFDDENSEYGVGDEIGEDGEKKENKNEINGGALVAVNVKTGEPLAIASWPTYDVSTLLENYNDILTAKNTPLYNRATQGEYAPGSTFKPCTAIGALTEGIISTETYLPCDGIYTRYEDAGYAPRCWVYGSSTHGPDNVSEALRDSCNCFFYEVGRQLGVDKMGKYAKLLGLGEPTGIEISESTGNMSNRETHYSWVQEEWTIGDTLQSAIGQSDSMFTPLQLAEYCAAVANNGERHSASLLKSVRSFDYSKNVYERETEVLSKAESPQYNWDAVKKGMWMVANDWAGSCCKLFMDYDASTVACKTGTAQKGEGIINDGIFICYAPFEDPEIAIAVVIQHAGAGANCGSIAREVLEAYFNMKTTLNITETEGTLLK